MHNEKKVGTSIQYPKLLKSSCCDKPLVSVVVPVYNVRPYLEECLDSLRSQSLRNIEIICVDDGSTDASLSYLLAIAEADERITVLTKKNSGLSDTRNCGIDIAKGKYIYFCDSDDYLEQEALEACYLKAEKENLDMVLFSVEVFGNGEGCTAQTAFYQKYYARKHAYDGVYSGIELFAELQMHQEYLMSACLYIMKKELLAKHGHRFISGILHEDNAFTFEVLLSAEKAGFINKKYYHRRLHADSIMTKRTSIANVAGLLTSYVHMVQFLEKYSYPKIYQANIMQQLAITLQAAQATYNKLDEEDKSELVTDSMAVRVLYHNILSKGKKETLLKDKAIHDYHILKDYTDKHIQKLKETIEALKENNRISKSRSDERYNTLKNYTDQHINKLKEVIAQMKDNNKLLQKHGNRAREALQVEKAANNKLRTQNADLQKLLLQEEERGSALEKHLLELQKSTSLKIGRALTYVPRMFCKVFNSK